MLEVSSDKSSGDEAEVPSQETNQEEMILIDLDEAPMEEEKSIATNLKRGRGRPRGGGRNQGRGGKHR